MNVSADANRRIDVHVPALTRVEGEGSLTLKVSDGRIEDLRLSIFEPPRYFEKFLENRHHDEVADIVARICGICPIAYQMSAVQAIEQAYGVEVSPWVTRMRRVFYCGEWLQSHSLHIHLLAAPDFLGFESAIAMAEKYPEEVQRGLRLQGIGNRLISLFGGRSVHPVGARVGGFHHAPTPAQVRETVAALKAELPEAEALVRWLGSLSLPDDPQTFTSVALRHPEEYPMYAGRIVSDAGLDIAVDDYETHFRETHEAHSTALFSYLDGKPYLVGPLARLNLNLDRLPASTRALLDETGVRFPGSNMFHSILARAVELHVALVEAIRLLEDYEEPDMPYVQVTPRAGTGYGATEAPRGILWHRYDVSAEGLIRFARIVPPTSQNQARIEEDLHRSLMAVGLDKDDETLRLHCEMVIRNYDPCISCATHFLDLRVERS
ncbi:MAG: Ni/Fe hydrogenase subunit alpha [Halothiobacillaceae bacterium]